MEAARLREWYSAAQALIAELSAKATNSGQLDAESHGKHFQLYRLAHRIKKGAGKLKQGESRAIWSERAATLHSEVHELTSSIVQSSNQGLTSSVLAAAASATEAIEKEKAELQEGLQAAKYTCEALEATIAEHVKAREVEAAAALELRTRAVVLQQDAQRQETDARELSQRLQAALKERDALAGEKERMEEDARARAQLAESQGQVIAQLMADSEESKKELEGLWSRVKDSENEAHVLRVNLGNHSQVIEKLILLNEEVMEAGNKYAVLKEEQAAIGARVTSGQEAGVSGGTSNLAHIEEGTTVVKETSEKKEGTGAKPGRRLEQSYIDLKRSPSEGTTSDEELPVSGVSEEGKSDVDGRGRLEKQPELTKKSQSVKEDGTSHHRRLGEQSAAAKPRSQDKSQVSYPEKDHSAPFEQGRAAESIPSDETTSNSTAPAARSVPEKPVKWTSNMLPLPQRPVSPHAEEDSSHQEQSDPASWVGSKIQGVGGRARGLFNYVAGTDRATVHPE